MRNLCKKFKPLTVATMLGTMMTTQAWAACYCYQYNAFEAAYITSYKSIENTMDVTTPNAFTDVSTQIIERLELLNQAMLKSMEASDTAIVAKIQEVGLILRDRLQKTTQAQIRTKMAGSNYKTEKKVQRALSTEAQKFSNPITSCMQYAAGGTFNKGLSHVKASAAATTLDLTTSAASAGQNGVGWEQKEYQYNKSAFGDSKDFLNAGLLFSGQDGKATRTEEDAKSLPSLLNYLVNYSASPKAVSTKQDRTFTGRRYSDLQRRNAAYMGIEAYTISNSMLRAQPNKSLNAFYEAADLTLTAEQEEEGVSVNEMLSTYAQKMMSKPQVEFLASASETAAMKSLLQAGSVYSLVNLEGLKSSLQKEALIAAELSLMTEKVISPSMQQLARDIAYNK